jgi:hypothetical protein
MNSRNIRTKKSKDSERAEHARRERKLASVAGGESCSIEKAENMFWGPCFWKTIHTIAAAYNPSKKNSFLLFINSLPDLLPCKKCSEHMRQNLRVFPPNGFLSSREELFTWTYRFHDIVNRSKEYPTTSPPLATVKKYYYEGIYSCEKCNLG